MNTAKQKHMSYWLNFSRFLSDVLLMIFMNMKCQWDFIMGKNPVAQILGCHDLHTADGDSEVNSDS